MCGLAMISDSFISDNETEFFRDLMVLTSLRGLDSSGVATVFKPGYNAKVSPLIRTAKALGNVYNLVLSSAYSRMVRPPSERSRFAMFGHCRAATKGHKTVDNAHPFTCNHITGVHNGTITGGLTIPEGETDSQAIFERIAEKGVEGLEGIQGAYALIWYNSEEHTINVLRNNDRPLFYGFRGNMLVVASEKAFLEMLSERGQKIEGITSFEPFVHYKVSATHVNFKKSKERFETVDVSFLKPKVTNWNRSSGSRFRESYYSDAYGYGDWEDRYTSDGKGGWIFKSRDDESEGKKETSETDEKTGGKSTSILEVDNSHWKCIPGTYEVMGTQKYETFLSMGCVMCGEVSSRNSWHYGANVDGEWRYICEECSETQVLDEDPTVTGIFPGLAARFKADHPNMRN